MNNMKFDLLNNKNKRELMMIEERLDALDKVKEVVFIKGTKYMTTQMVSDYYEVTESTINSVIGRRREELTKNGMKKFTNKELKSLNIQDEYFKIPNTGMILFNKRSILNVGTLLEDSQVAEKVRTLLLDNHEQLINVSDVLENEEEITEEDINESDHEKIENREFYVYVHIRLDNNTVFYVGKGHGNRAYNMSRGEGTHHDNICKACDCKAVIIKDNLTESQAFRLESKMIKYYVHTLGYGINIEGYSNYDHKLPHLTNRTWGGEGTSGLNAYANKTEEEMEEIRRKKSESMKGKKFSEERNKKISKTLKGKMVGEKHPMWGKHYSEEHNKKIGEANSKKVICITTGKKFDSIKDASDYYKCNNINACCKGRLKSAGKLNGVRLQWKYLEDYDDNCLEEYKLNISDKRIKKVICITTGKKFDSIKDASNYYNILNQSNISRVCRGELRSAGKLNGVRLQWKFLEDYDDNCLEEYKLNIGDKRIKKVICITTGETFDSIKDAEKHYSCIHISLCCKGKQNYAGKLKDGTKLQWKYAEDDDNESKAV